MLGYTCTIQVNGVSTEEHIGIKCVGVIRLGGVDDITPDEDKKSNLQKLWFIFFPVQSQQYKTSLFLRLFQGLFVGNLKCSHIWQPCS